jgi:hypothetical protein
MRVVIKQEDVPVVEGTQASRELTEGSVVVVDCPSGSYRLLNDSGSFLWSCIDGELSVKNIAEKLAETYELEEEQALSDTNHFIEHMLAREMISWKK